MSDNLLTGPADYDEYCMSTPASGRLYDVVRGLSPGQSLCGCYDIRPELFGQSKRLVTIADKFGNQSRTWNGFVFSVDGRLPNGIRVTGGLDLGTQTIGHCFTVLHRGRAEPAAGPVQQSAAGRAELYPHAFMGQPGGFPGARRHPAAG